METKGCIYCGDSFSIYTFVKKITHFQHMKLIICQLYSVKFFFFFKANKQGISLQTKHAIIIPSNCTLGYLSQKNENLCLYRKTTGVFTEALFILVKKKQQLGIIQMFFSG